MGMGKKNYLFPSTLLSFIHNFLALLLIILTFSWDDQQQILALRSTSTGPDYLQVPPGSTFKIALFADLHYGENAWSDWGPEHDVNSTRVMSIVLDKEQPDFVIYLGDVITANNMLVQNASLYWDQAISPTRKRGIPWASVFGNHDDTPFVWPMEWFSAPGIPQLICPNVSDTGEKDCRFKGTPRLELMQQEIRRNNLSYSKSGPENLWPSVSNYVLKLSSSTDPQLAVAYMYFFDSGGGAYPGVISNAQANWFQYTSQQLNPDSRVPEIVFWHIPSQAYKDVALHKNCVGSMFTEEVAAQDEELGIMKLFERRSSIKAIFAGHNHGLDWCCPHEKLWLCYARHTGYGGYGTWAKGVRILEISEKPFSLKSWIRMEDGDSHSTVVLSSSE